MQAKLIVVVGKTDKDTVTLQLPSVIGRSREVELTVAHPMISRRHCEVFEVDGLMMIRDLGSLNGTVVNGQRIDQVPLRPDDEFTIGPITFRARYEYEGDLSNLPAAKLAGKKAQQPEVEAGECKEEETTEAEEPTEAETTEEDQRGQKPLPETRINSDLH